MTAFQRYLVLTPFAQADVLQKILQIRKLAAQVVPTESGAVVYRDIPRKEYDDWDISELLGVAEDTTVFPNQETSDGTTLAEDFHDFREFTAEENNDPLLVAKVLSHLSPYGVVLFTVELAEDIGGEVGVSGIVHAKRVVAGKVDEEMAAGLLLSVLDQKIEDLLIAPFIQEEKQEEKKEQEPK